MRFLTFIVFFMMVNSAFAGHHHINKPTSKHNASWYDASRGRTASGMRHTYSVAHRSLPFGTRLRVTNVRNGRSVEAVVTDRGPFVKGRTLDITEAIIIQE